MVYTTQYFRDGYQNRDLAMLDPRKLWNFLAVQIRDKSGPIIVGRPGRGSSSWPFDWFTGYCSTRRTSFFIDTPQNRSSSDRNVSRDPSNSAWASRAIKFSVYKHTATPRHAAPRIVRTNHHREQRFLSKTPSKRLISSKILQNHSTFCPLAVAGTVLSYRYRSFTGKRIVPLTPKAQICSWTLLPN